MIILSGLIFQVDCSIFYQAYGGRIHSWFNLLSVMFHLTVLTFVIQSFIYFFFSKCFMHSLLLPKIYRIQPMTKKGKDIYTIFTQKYS